MITFAQWVVDVEHEYARMKPDWRRGQTYFNLFYDLNPIMANFLRGTNLDPFHDDGRIPVFLEFLAQKWNTPTVTAMDYRRVQ